MKKAWILNVGTEVTSGRVINTNAAHLARELERVGVEVEKCVAVTDDEPAIVSEIKTFLASKSGLLITTGGLGATDDDITRRAVAIALERKLIPGLVHAGCMIPAGAETIENRSGTADGFIVFHQDKTLVSLVGPPAELRPMFQDALERLYPHARATSSHREYTVVGGTEADFEALLAPLKTEFPYVSINPYCYVGRIRYVIKGEGERFDLFVTRFRELLSDYIIGEGDLAIEEAVVAALKERKLRISFAESCTGGMLASKIINVPGASDVIGESFVVYSNAAKMKYLGISAETLAQHGTVSDETVRAMVTGLEKLQAGNVLVAVSGIAGPDGGTAEKPVGLVHCAIRIAGVTHTVKRVFKGDRNLVRERASCWVLNTVWRLLRA
jgi:nicotinamide-nucleotide amidase